MVESRFGEAEYFLSGSTYQMALMNQYVTRGLVRSILTGLLMITVLMVLVFRSFRMGLIAMIPNVFPMLICGAVMGFARDSSGVRDHDRCPPYNGPGRG